MAKVTEHAQSRYYWQPSHNPRSVSRAFHDHQLTFLKTNQKSQGRSFLVRRGIFKSLSRWMSSPLYIFWYHFISTVPRYLAQIIFFFPQRQTACRILIPWPGIELKLWQWKHWILTTTRELSGDKNVHNAFIHYSQSLSNWKWHHYSHFNNNPRIGSPVYLNSQPMPCLLHLLPLRNKWVSPRT